jgi:hypothetical protein
MMTSNATVVFAGQGYVEQHLSQLNRSAESIFVYELSRVTPNTVEECVKHMKETGKKCVVPSSDSETVSAGAVYL